ncbi:hypothetical protein [Mycetocola tolaasinivorans]|nr:hypothetical protein [Mycetocola tolaasinivorans]
MTDTVTDLDDLVAHPDRYLVSMYAEPARAAELWHRRLRTAPYGSEGSLSLTYFGHELLGPRLWDEVTGIWCALIDTIADFTVAGAGERLFPGQPVPIRLERAGSRALFSVNGTRTLVAPELFIPGVLTAAASYCRWVEEHVGASESSLSAQTERLLQARETTG